MNKNFALVALFVLLCSATVYADGMIIPEPIPPHPHPELLEVKYHHVNVTIDNQFTETDIDQVFHNPNSWDIEGTYLFPLPEGASIQKFSMYVDGKELQGEVLDASEARRTYEDLVRKLVDPGLLEYVDRNTFKARVYPIEKNSDKRVKLDYSEVIPCENGICEYTYPLNTERFSSKNLDDVVINVEIKSNIAIKNVYSPSHEIEVKRISDYEVQVSYEEEDVKPDTDFKLIYTLSEDDIGINMITHKDGDTGYFLLMLAPKVAGTSQISEKDVVFVLDKSGSMAGEKIDEAKDALKFCLNSLNSGDRFGIVTFSTGVNTYKEGLETATTANVRDAVTFADGIEALGGTDIDSALIEAMEMLPNDDRPKMVIFLTDGEPTVGITDINQIIKDVDAQNTGDARLFVFGIGYDVNTHLLDKLSLDNHGASEYVVEGENIETKVSSFYEKVSNPVMSDVSLVIEANYRIEEMYPKEVPDIFKGTQILVFGQYTGHFVAMSGVLYERPAVTITGKINGVQSSVTYFASFPDENGDNDFLPRLWATRKIGYLLDEIRLEGENDELVDEIITLSKKYGIATPYTSFLILEDEPVASAGQHLREAFAPTTGANAVDTSQSIWGYKGASASGAAAQEISGPGGQTTTIKYVGSKTFIEKDGVLTDTDYVEGTTTKNLKYGSDAYFAALATNPGLGQYFAIGKNIIVCVGGTCINIGENFSGTEDVIGDLGLNEETSQQCNYDADCKVDNCNCACVPVSANIPKCVREISCLQENGVTGCKCTSGVCTPVLDPNWNPPGFDCSMLCGDGACQSSPLVCEALQCACVETPASCPADCEVEEGQVLSEGDRLGEIELLIAIVIVLIAAVILVRLWQRKRERCKETK